MLRLAFSFIGRLILDLWKNKLAIILNQVLNVKSDTIFVQDCMIEMAVLP